MTSEEVLRSLALDASVNDLLGAVDPKVFDVSGWPVPCGWGCIASNRLVWQAMHPGCRPQLFCGPLWVPLPTDGDGVKCCLWGNGCSCEWPRPG